MNLRWTGNCNFTLILSRFWLQGKIQSKNWQFPNSYPFISFTVLQTKVPTKKSVRKIFPFQKFRLTLTIFSSLISIKNFPVVNNKFDKEKNFSHDKLSWSFPCRKKKVWLTQSFPISLLNKNKYLIKEHKNLCLICCWSDLIPITMVRGLANEI